MKCMLGLSVPLVLAPVLVLVLVLITVLAAAPARADEGAAPMKPVLVVMDVQRDFMPYMDPVDVKRAPEYINGAIALFRQHGLPVIRVYHTDPKWGPSPDSAGFQYLPSIMIKDEDPKVVKNYPSAFKKTELDRIIREKGANTVFLCGLSATGCVLATYHAAQDLDYTVFMLKEGMISPDARQTDVIEEICESISYTALKALLDNIRT